MVTRTPNKTISTQSQLLLILDTYVYCCGDYCYCCLIVIHNYCRRIVETLVCWVRSVVHKFTSTVDANPFLAAKSCLVADRNSCILMLQSFLASSIYIVVMASWLMVSNSTSGRSRSNSVKNSSFKSVLLLLILPYATWKNTCYLVDGFI